MLPFSLSMWDGSLVSSFIYWPGSTRPSMSLEPRPLQLSRPCGPISCSFLFFLACMLANQPQQKPLCFPISNLKAFYSHISPRVTTEQVRVFNSSSFLISSLEATFRLSVVSILGWKLCTKVRCTRRADMFDHFVFFVVCHKAVLTIFSHVHL